MDFCKTDERKTSFKACEMLKKILIEQKDGAVETIKKLMKTDMVLAKECATRLIVTMLPLLQDQ